MVTCPKCDMQMHPGTRRCPICGTPTSLLGFRPDPRRAPAPVIDPLLDLFERDELVAYCPDCMNEFSDPKGRCRRCERTLIRRHRTTYEEDLLCRPLHDWGERVAQGPPTYPRDLVRVRIARGLEEAQACLEELRFVGLEPVAGSDSLDPFDDPESIGIYVRSADHEAATFMVARLKPEDPLMRPPGRERRTWSDPLTRARAFGEMGKYRDALRILATLEAQGEAAALSAEFLLRSGRVRAAERFALEKASAPFPPRERGRLLGESALMGCLGHDGTPFGEGARPAAALDRAREGVALAPRVVSVGKILVEILEGLDRKREVLSELNRLERLSPNLLGHDGWWRTLRG